MARKRSRGWYGESARHAAAAMGIKTVTLPTRKVYLSGTTSGYVLNETGERVGRWMTSRASSRPGALWISDIHLHPRYQRRGYGKLALDEIERQAAEAGYDELELAATDKGLYVWPKLGFEFADKPEIVEYLRGYDVPVHKRMSSLEIVSAPGAKEILFEMGEQGLQAIMSRKIRRNDA